MSILNIFVHDDDNPHWKDQPDPTHVANTDHGGIEAVIVKGGMASGKSSVALRVDFIEPTGEDGPVVIFELSESNIEMLLAAMRGLTARGEAI